MEAVAIFRGLYIKDLRKKRGHFHHVRAKVQSEKTSQLCTWIWPRSSFRTLVRCKRSVLQTNFWIKILSLEALRLHYYHFSCLPKISGICLARGSLTKKYNPTTPRASRNKWKSAMEQSSLNCNCSKINVCERKWKEDWLPPWGFDAFFIVFLYYFGTCSFRIWGKITA